MPNGKWARILQLELADDLSNVTTKLLPLSVVFMDLALSPEKQTGAVDGQAKMPL